jgi:Cytochrome c3
MKNHVFRPLFVVIGIIVLVLAARTFYVPKDFGVHERGYMYGWYRQSNIEDWKKVLVKYQGMEYCKDCHDKKYASIKKSPHQNIQCENCHGPAIDHPSEPPKLAIDRSRQQCLRCHYPLPYPSSGRSKIRGIDPEKHNPDIECSMCHDPHRPNLGGMR